ncbi:MAG: 16S rRNA (guanine(966)-N(2))-methyltransferase RsmD [Cyanobacteria bacterium P01_A01_bin.45]
MSLRIYGNRQLKTVPGKDTRPTVARVREAVFNIWQGTITECRWLDLCAGTGSMGAEALCRGASLVIGIEQSGRACGVIKQNWEQVASDGQKWQLFKGDVVGELAKLSQQLSETQLSKKKFDPIQFDRIYFDPPYASELYRPVLETIHQQKILEVSGEIAVEHNPKTWTPIAVDGWEICRQKVYGNTGLTFYVNLGY